MTVKTLGQPQIVPPSIDVPAESEAEKKGIGLKVTFEVFGDKEMITDIMARLPSLAQGMVPVAKELIPVVANEAGDLAIKLVSQMSAPAQAQLVKGVAALSSAIAARVASVTETAQDIAAIPGRVTRAVVYAPFEAAKFGAGLLFGK
jgi:uncharacterized protein YunC (DUF1805 family)